MAKSRTAENYLDELDNDPAASLTPDEAHRIVGRDKISRSAWYAGIKRGEIPSIRIGKRILIPKFALRRMLAGQGERA
jgi:hypothetical protein